MDNVIRNLMLDYWEAYLASKKANETMKAAMQRLRALGVQVGDSIEVPNGPKIVVTDLFGGDNSRWQPAFVEQWGIRPAKS